MANTNNTEGGNYSVAEIEVSEDSIGTALKILGFTIIFIFSIGGNGLISLGILLTQKRHQISFTNLCILNLSIADIIIALTIPFSAHYDLANTFVFGVFLCKTIYSIRNIAIYASLIILIYISYDRYQATVLSNKYQIVKKYAVVVAILAWFLAACATIPQMICLNVVDYGSRSSCQEVWQGTNSRVIYTCVITVIFFFIPLGIITVFHILIAKWLWAKSRQLGNQAKSLDKRKTRILLMLFFVVLAFFICHLPPNVFFLLGDFGAVQYTPGVITAIWVTIWLAYSHSLWNPLIYGVFNQALRTSILKVIFKIKQEDRL